MDFAVYGTLKHGMVQYFGIDMAADILCVGHSHTVLGIDAKRLAAESERPVVKYAVAGANVIDRYWMIQHYLSMYTDLRLVIYDVDTRLFDTAGISSASYTLFFPLMDNPVMADYIKQQATWQERLTCQLIKTARYRDQTLNMAVRGLTGRQENAKTTSVRPRSYKRYLAEQKARKIKIDPEALALFRRTVEELSGRGIRVALVYIPVLHILNEIDPVNQKQVYQVFQELADMHENVDFWDYNQDYEHDLALFYDLRHVNARGKQIVSERLADDVKKVFTSKAMRAIQVDFYKNDSLKEGHEKSVSLDGRPSGV